MPNQTRLFISVIIPLLILSVPISWIPVQGISTIEHRFIAIFAMATLFWILEPIPIFSTSLLIIFVELVMVSDKSFVWFKEQVGDVHFGTVLTYQEIMATFASPVIMLFLGGFFLAMTATKYRLDMNLARILLQPFGKNPRHIMLGLMIITAFFSMFMSNTATTAMMLAILTPVLAAFKDKDPGKAGFVLSIPFAANIGGMGTPIGTPPNAIALKYLTGEAVIGFGTWMSFAVPFVALLLLFAWLLLSALFPVETETIDLNIKSRFLKNWRAFTVYVTFAVTILLWLLDSLHGMNSYIVAMIPVVVFTATRIITTEDLRKISWDVLWLVAGGIALGTGLEKSGLSLHLIESIPFSVLSPLTIVFLATLLTILMANFISNTATANLLLPIMAALGASLPGLQALGGGTMIILAVTFSASLAMSLPVSTPPNAIAHASGLIQSRDMSKVGIIIGVTGLLGVYLLMFILNQVGFL